MNEPRLETRIGAVTLANPILVASGTFGYGDEAVELTRARQLGGIVTKTVTLEPRRGNAPLRLHETPAGLLNSIGLQNVGVDRFRAEKLPRLSELGVPIVASIGGRRAEEFVEVARRLDGAPGVVALEVNVSCPNVKEGGLEFCQIPASAADVVAKVGKVTSLPLWAKLSPNLTSIGELARACADAGAAALTAINTFVGLSVDVRTRRSHIPGGTGGLSGPAIRPLALAKVRETVRAADVPVVGVGGIATWEDVVEFLVVGARAVQMGTISFRIPDAAAHAVEGLSDFLRSEGLGDVEELIGTYVDPQSPRDPSPATAKER